MKIGIRHEDKYRWEARTPITPDDVARLVAAGIEIAVQPSPQRAFTTEQFAAAGALVQEDLSDCDTILGVKEMPPAQFQPGRLYAFFSHTIKGQPYNMDMLKDLMSKGCHLIDYECITNEAGQRTVFFGVHAGLAGMINTLWAYGQRLEHEGLSSPLGQLKQALKYQDLAEAEADIRDKVKAARADGSLKAVGPIVMGITGDGRVANGVHHIIKNLEPIEVEASQLASTELKDGEFYAVSFDLEDMYERTDGKQFDVDTYYRYPLEHRARLASYLPHLSMLLNCIYWEEPYPRIVTKDDIAKMWSTPKQPRLRVIGDISCDIGGSIEVTVRGTGPGDPLYVYIPKDGSSPSGIEGHGPVMMAIEILPTELPRDSSRAFSESLFLLVKDLAATDPSKSWEEWDLPLALKRATILHHGKFTERYRYMEKYLK